VLRLARRRTRRRPLIGQRPRRLREGRRPRRRAQPARRAKRRRARQGPGVGRRCLGRRRRDGAGKGGDLAVGRVEQARPRVGAAGVRERGGHTGNRGREGAGRGGTAAHLERRGPLGHGAAGSGHADRDGGHRLAARETQRGARESARVGQAGVHGRPFLGHGRFVRDLGRCVDARHHHVDAGVGREGRALDAKVDHAAGRGGVEVRDSRPRRGRGGRSGVAGARRAEDQRTGRARRRRGAVGARGDGRDGGAHRCGGRGHRSDASGVEVEERFQEIGGALRVVRGPCDGVGDLA
jgi:hypothetical protein